MLNQGRPEIFVRIINNLDCYLESEYGLNVG